MIRRRTFRGAAAGLLLAACPAAAYSIPTHVRLTERAVEEYEVCRGVNGWPALPAGAAAALSRANAYEDGAFWIKALNWHFYHPGRDLGTGTLGMGRGSLLPRFQTLEERTRLSPSLSGLGGLMHYLQDVTNPAHVAPVYHVSGDSFDNYDFAFPERISEAECRALAPAASTGTYVELLDATARETLRRMEEFFPFREEGRASTIRWREAFWSPDDGPGSKQAGFGRYGRFGNHFGGTRPGGADVDPVIYEDFGRRQMRQALDASILAIRLYSASFPPR